MHCQERRRELHLTAAHAGVCGLPRRVASGGPLSADERRGNAPSNAGKSAWVKPAAGITEVLLPYNDNYGRSLTQLCKPTSSRLLRQLC